MNAKSRYIPLDATEKAALEDINTLLPIEVYEKLAALIRQALKKLPTGDAALNDTRSHNAISIDGDRGTGKTAVLVNLKRYLSRADGLGGTTDAATDRELLSSVHVLDPIDPTLLEDGESLLLHGVVAAVLHDKELKERQRRNPERHRELNIALEHLAHGLESVESQKTSRGMDTIRALHSNQRLGECVENFFKAALHLLEKKLLVLLIDDVDTALNRAFENLEIIRRYLTTPYVLPILTGDRGLYDEVVWRDFHGRLTKDSSYLSDQAYEVARDLATEYQRKILPVQRRLTMPQVADYWKDDGVKLRGDGKDIPPLQNFYAWLQIFIGGPVNGREGSEMDIPIPSVRALIQLVNHCGDLIPGLPEGVCNATSAINAKRAWQMPGVPVELIEGLALRKRVTGQKKSGVGKKIKGGVKNMINGGEYPEWSRLWVGRLSEYFRHEPRGGRVYLSLLAMEHWSRLSENSSGVGGVRIFDTPLFQPLEHVKEEFVGFNRVYGLSEWVSQYNEMLPEVWLRRVGQVKTILPYPTPEFGDVLSGVWYYERDIDKAGSLYSYFRENKNILMFVVGLLVSNNFYSDGKFGVMLNIGRVFELIIASLVGEVSLSEARRILASAPFFSVTALAPTKTVYGEGVVGIRISDNGKLDPSGFNYVDGRSAPLLIDGAEEVCKKIASWRKDHELGKVKLSPWLVYKVFNKVFNQVSAGVVRGVVGTGSVTVPCALSLVKSLFNATWSAFGSFEKGNFFGLDDEVVTSNVAILDGFEKGGHYEININPFISSENGVYGGREMRAVSFFMKDHPIKQIIDDFDDNRPGSDIWGEVKGAPQFIGLSGFNG